MSKLQEQLDAIVAGVKQQLPEETYEIISNGTATLKASGIEGRVVQNGEQVPDFTLANHLDEPRTLSAMLGEGPLVVSFYRGGW